MRLIQFVLPFGRSPKRLSLLLLLLATSAPAATVMFTFDSFTPLQTTPLLNCSPDVGPSSFQASFTSSPSDAAFSIVTILVNPSFSGQLLMDVSPPGSSDTLTVTLNSPIHTVQLDFALFMPGYLELDSSAGTAYASTGDSQAGNLSFQSETGFTEFSLTGFDASNQATMLAIDNLRLTPTTVPEPSTWAMLGLGVAALVIRRRGKQSSLPTFGRSSSTTAPFSVPGQPDAIGASR
jgi:hypothetical protein